MDNQVTRRTTCRPCTRLSRCDPSSTRKWQDLQVRELVPDGPRTRTCRVSVGDRRDSMCRESDDRRSLDQVHDQAESPVRLVVHDPSLDRRLKRRRCSRRLIARLNRQVRADDRRDSRDHPVLRLSSSASKRIVRLVPAVLFPSPKTHDSLYTLRPDLISMSEPIPRNTGTD